LTWMFLRLLLVLVWLLSPCLALLPYSPLFRSDAGDLGKCVSIFHVLAIVFAGTHTATEINAGSTARANNELGVLDAERAEAIREIEEHTSELQSRFDLVCRLLLENKNSDESVG